MRSQKEAMPSSNPAEASDGAADVAQQGEWKPGETRPFWIRLKANPSGPRKVLVTVVAGAVLLDLKNPENEKHRVLLTKDILDSLRNNQDLDIRPAAPLQQDPRGKMLTKRQIQPVVKRQPAASASPSPEAPEAAVPQPEPKTETTASEPEKE